MPVRHIFTTAAASTNFVSNWVPLDVHGDSPNIGWSINKSTTGGAIRALVQVTQDDVGQPGTSAAAFTISTFSADVAETTVGAYTSPVAAIRVSVSASASSNVTFRVLQVCP